MKRPKIYLETSVISYLDQQGSSEQTADTLKFWEKAQEGEYDIFVSPVVMEEIKSYNAEKSFIIQKHMDKVCINLLPESKEVEELAKLYAEGRILTERNFDDCKHIAYACVYNCDMIVSWNFRCIVNYKTICEVKSVNAVAGYREMGVYTPTMLI
ncbi:MAG: PIN domain-containing protein [Chitinispirillales bacterium]|jgi:predicted nucleic acid-binding protein|nr:PIN domain-containing protein [Chitinispirillales bacterium]